MANTNTTTVTLGSAHELSQFKVVPYYVEHLKKRVTVAKIDGTLYAFDDLCPYRPSALSAGLLDGKVIMCQCDGSKFDVTTGKVLKGPATANLRTYPVREKNGTVEVEMTADEAKPPTSQTKLTQVQEPADAHATSEVLKRPGQPWAVHTTVEIDAPPEQAWEVFVDFDNYDWPTTGLLSMEGTVADGATVQVRFKVMLLTLTTERVLHVVPGKSLSWASSAAPGLHDNHHYIFEPIDGGKRTRLTQTDSSAGPVGLLAGRVVSGVERGEYNKWNLEFKRRVESRAQG